MCNYTHKVRVQSSITGASYFIDAPCGRCVECIKKRQNDWKLRLCEECSNWKYLYFFTLTYNDSALPYNVIESTGECLSSARKSDVQLWLKRFREQYQRSHSGRRLEMKYFICAEYGPRGTKRPHYHGMIMTDVPKKDMVSLFLDWQESKGFTRWKSVVPTDKNPDIRSHRMKCANYISKYCCKGEFASRKCHIRFGLIEKAWSVMSKNIGLSYVQRMSSYHLPKDFRVFSIDGWYTEDDVWQMLYQPSCARIFDEIDTIVSRCRVVDGQYTYSMPRYYRDRIYGKKIRKPRCVSSSESRPLPCLHVVNSCPRVSSSSFARYYCPPPSSVSKCEVLKELRYSHENFVSVAMRVYLLHWHDVEYRDLFRSVRKMFPTLSNAEVVRKIEADKLAAAKYREISAKRSLCEFYTSNMFRNPELSGLCD